MMTSVLNRKLELVKVKNLKFGSKSKYCSFDGHALFIKGYGYIAFRDSFVKGTSIQLPYSPCGGRKALKCILDAGGFLSYKDLNFVKPFND